LRPLAATTQSTQLDTSASPEPPSSAAAVCEGGGPRSHLVGVGVRVRVRVGVGVGVGVRIRVRARARVGVRVRVRVRVSPPAATHGQHAVEMARAHGHGARRLRAEQRAELHVRGARDGEQVEGAAA